MNGTCAVILIGKLPIDILKKIEGYRVGYDPRRHCLWKLVIYNNLEGLKWIVEHTKVNIRVHNDWALAEAACRGYFDMVKYLISKGLDVRANDNAAIRCATCSGSKALDMVKYLVSQGADPNAAVMSAIRHDKDMSMIKYLTKLIDKLKIEY